METMSHTDALELVKLRIDEDKISWKLAYDEYRQLTGRTIYGTIETGKYLREYLVTVQ